MELAVRTWGFNPELLGKVVEIEGKYFDGDDNRDIRGVFVVHEIKGDEIALKNVVYDRNLDLELHHFDIQGEYGLKLRILGQVDDAVMPSECSEELWGEEDDDA